MGYTQHALRGFGWIGIIRAVAKALTLVKFILLARILTPGDIGMYGIVTIVLALLEMVSETGINAFLMGQSKVETFVNTAWVISLVRGVLLSSILLLLAWPVSVFYVQPGLLPLLLVASMIPFLRGAINPMVITFLKKLHYKQDALLKGTMMLIEASVGIFLTYQLKNPVGLLLGLATSVIFEVFFTFIYFSVRPKFQLSKPQLKQILSFGKWLNINGFLYYLSQTLDDLIVGKVLNTTQLGYYQTGFNVAQTSTNDVAEVANQSLFPVFNTMKAGKPELWNLLKRAMITTAIALSIGSIVLAVNSEWIVRLVLGEKWMPIVPILPWLLAAGVIQSLNSLLYPVFIVYKQPKQQFIVFSSYLVLMCTLVTVFGKTYGLLGVSIALLVARILVQPLVYVKLRQLMVSKA